MPWLVGAPLPPIELSIEIFPPKTAEAEARLAQPRAVRGCEPALHLGHLRCGRDGQRRHLPLVRGVQERLGTPAAAHSLAPSPRARRSRGSHAAIGRPASVGSWRSAATRPRMAATFAAPRRLRLCQRPDLGPAPHRRLRDQRRLLPGGHPEAGSALADLENLKRKVEAGATPRRDQPVLLRHRPHPPFPRCDGDAGIRAEFVPGIMPIHNFTQIRRFSQGCGASIPAWLEQLFAGVDESSPLHSMLAASVAVEQCRRLAAEGLTQFHVYALNRAELPLALLRLLGITAPSLPPPEAGEPLDRLPRPRPRTRPPPRRGDGDADPGPRPHARRLPGPGELLGGPEPQPARPDPRDPPGLSPGRGRRRRDQQLSAARRSRWASSASRSERSRSTVAAQLAHEAVETLAGDGRARFVIGAIGPAHASRAWAMWPIASWRASPSRPRG